MKIIKLSSVLFSALLFLTITTASAQFGDLLQKAKDKAAKKADDMMNKKAAGSADQETNSGTKKNSRLVINQVFDFVPGDSILVHEDFARFPVGTSPATIKTNGAGVIVTVGDQPGKWLALQGDATYRLTKQYFYPARFTVEFDLLAAADRISDMYPVNFGFTNDNSAREYLSDAGEYVSLLYYNNNEVIVANHADNHLSTKFDLTPYANRVMHVSLVVDGQNMVVYLDKTKMADTRLFAPGDVKNFYISAPLQYSNGAKLLFSNLTIAAFRKNTTH